MRYSSLASVAVTFLYKSPLTSLRHSLRPVSLLKRFPPTSLSIGSGRSALFTPFRFLGERTGATLIGEPTLKVEPKVKHKGSLAQKKKEHKMSSSKKYYAVAHGRERGIYSNWGQCSAQVLRYPGACYKGCATLAEARAFLNANPVSLPSSSTPCGSPSCGGSDPSASFPLGAAPAPVSGKRKRHGNAADGEEERVSQRRVERSPPLQPPAERSKGASVRHAQQHDVFVDGACSNNGRGSGSRAGYGGYYGDGDCRNFSCPLSPDEAHTNNRAELHAVIHALRQGVADGGVSPDGDGCQNSCLGRLCVHTDSKYVLEGLTKYSRKWTKNDYRLSDGSSPVLNQDLWKVLISLRDTYNTCYAAQVTGVWRKYDSSNTRNDGTEGFEIRHVKGHANIRGNELADRLAVLGAQQPYL